jgi:hypothetical protein
MGFLKVADRETKRFEHKAKDGSVDAWIEVRARMSKAEENIVQSQLPAEMMELQDVDVANDKKAAAIVMAHITPQLSAIIFEALVTSWSLEIPATKANYLSLEPEPAAWIDGIIIEHYNNSKTSQDELGKPSTSPKGSRKGTPATE